MIYSCFDPARAQYLYFEDGAMRPLNGDLPVPELPAETNGIGVPRNLAARALPAGASYVGSGWNARGVIVKCAESQASHAASLGEFPSVSSDAIPYLVLAGVAAAALFFAWGDF